VGGCGVSYQPYTKIMALLLLELINNNPKLSTVQYCTGVQIVLGGQVFSTVFSIRRGIAPAGSFVCESLLPPGLAGSKYV
jgi:hypothetical protein